MKIKKGIDVWRCFELALTSDSQIQYRYSGIQPINEILELEDKDWLTAIQLCKTHKKYNLKKEIESSYSHWKTNPMRTKVSKWLYEFKKQICYSRKYKQTAMDIRNEADFLFKEHIVLLNHFENLNRLFTSYNTTINNYQQAKDSYEKATRHMEAFKSIKNSGITPEDFDWGLIEPEQEEQR
jgi:hypothetical protein